MFICLHKRLKWSYFWPKLVWYEYPFFQYETEVTVLKQQLIEAQQQLNKAEVKLHQHEQGTNQLVSDWQLRLAESEERMRKQQAEKDDQMKNIIQRWVGESLMCWNSHLKMHFLWGYV